MFGVDTAFFFFAGFPEAVDLLQHGYRIVGHFQIHFGLFHGFEKRPLDTGSGNVGADQVVAGGDFVDFIDIDDSILGQFDIPVGLFDQVPNQILHIAADVSRLAELGGIPFDERERRFFWR